MNQEQKNKLISICYQAGEAIMEVYEKGFDVEYKEDKSPLTLADKNSNQIIVENLQQLFPHDLIISEETLAPEYESRKNSNKFWLIDPLDGTKEFIKRNGEFTVNIACVENGKPTIGLILLPTTKELFFTFEEGAVFKETNGGNRTQINVANKKEKFIAVTSRSHGDIEEEKFYQSNGIVEKITKGSSLKFCMIAEGKADLYFRSGPTMEWDTAAGEAILVAAGGKIEGITYNKPNLKNAQFICYGY